MSVMPYQNIYTKYRNAADDAITRSAIPRAYKEHVIRYFDAIKPENKISGQ